MQPEHRMMPPEHGQRFQSLRWLDNKKQLLVYYHAAQLTEKQEAVLAAMRGTCEQEAGCGRAERHLPRPKPPLVIPACLSRSKTFYHLTSALWRGSVTS